MQKIKRALFLINILFALNPNLNAQSSYELKITQDSDLLEVLDLLSNKYNIYFSYPVDALSSEQVSPNHITSQSIHELLTKLFHGTPISYKILNDGRVLLRKTENYALNAIVEEIDLKGKIMDKHTFEDIPFATVFLDTLGIGTQADEGGNFTLSVPARMSERKISIRMLGYQPLILKVAECQYGNNFQLESKPYTLGAITISDRTPSLSIDAEENTINLKDFSRNYASTLLTNDPLRNIQLLPGVSISDDLSSNIRIRGDAADGTLIVLDGIPIYKASHFYGIFSAINGDYLEEALLYKNTLPVAFGGKTGGMLQMNSPSHIDRLEATTEINLMTSSFSLRAPLSDNLNLYLGGRTSYQNVAETKFFELSGAKVSTSEDRADWLETEPEFRFYDLNARLSYRPYSNGQLDLSLFRSYDKFFNDYSIKYEVPLRNLPVGIKNQEVYLQEETWKNNGLSINYRHDFGKSVSLGGLVYYSKYSEEGSITARISQVLPLNTRFVDLRNMQQNSITDLGGKIQLKVNLSGSQYIQGGWELIKHENQFLFQEDSLKVFENNAKAWVNAGFANYHWEGLGEFSVDLGARISHYSLTGEIYAAPRVNIGYKLAPDMRLKGAYSINNQFVREVTHENRLGQSLGVIRLSNNNQFPVANAKNIMLGATLKRPHWTFDVEFYHKNISNVVEHARSILGVEVNQMNLSRGNTYKVFSGDGISKGVDALISVDYSPYSGWVSYTLSKTEQSFDEILDGTPFPSQDDRRHQLKWVNTLSLGNVDLSANYVFVSGRPYTDLSLFSEEKNRRELKPSERISRLPSYQRLDLGVNYNLTLPWVDIDLGISLFNTLNRDNVKYLQYIYSFSPQSIDSERNQIIGTETNLLDRTLNLSVKLNF